MVPDMIVLLSRSFIWLKENKMKIYVIGGRAKSGKNTFGRYLRDELKKFGYKPCVMRLTEPLYSYAKNYFEWDENKDEKPREFLQKMGIEIIKNKLGKECFLLDRLNEDIEILSNFFDTFIITDARLEKEFKYFKEKYHNTVTIKLERDNYDDMLSDEEKSHITELEIDKLEEFNYIVNSESLDDMKEKVSYIVSLEEGEVL